MDHTIFFGATFAISLLSIAYISFLYINYSAFIRAKAFMLYFSAWSFCVMCAVMNGGWLFIEDLPMTHHFLGEISLMQCAALSMVNICFSSLCKAYNKMRHISSIKIKDAMYIIKDGHINLSTTDTAKVLKDIISGTPEDVLRLNGEKIRNDSYVMKLVSVISFFTLFLSIILEIFMKLNIVK